MNKPLHILAGATLASALVATLPAHAGLLGGGSVGGALGGAGAIGPVGGALDGSLRGEGHLRAPSPRPVIDRTQHKIGVAKDTAVQTAGNVKDQAAATAAKRPAIGVDAAADGSAAGHVSKRVGSDSAIGASGAAEASTRKVGASAWGDGAASAETRNTSVNGSAGVSAGGSIKR